jgi:hypothetical protein
MVYQCEWYRPAPSDGTSCAISFLGIGDGSTTSLQRAVTLSYIMLTWSCVFEWGANKAAFFDIRAYIC